MTTWKCKTGDYHRQIVLDLGEASTTGASAVTFKMRPAAGGALAVNAAGTIESASRVSYQFTAPQLDTAGQYLLEVMLTYADGQETVPTSGQVVVSIEPRLG